MAPTWAVPGLLLSVLMNHSSFSVKDRMFPLRDSLFEDNFAKKSLIPQFRGVDAE